MESSRADAPLPLYRDPGAPATEPRPGASRAGEDDDLAHLAGDPPGSGFRAPGAPQKPSSPLRRILGPLIAAAVLLFNYGTKAFVLVSKLKFATTGISMLVSIGAYALLWTWQFAVGLVLLLLIHEMGHVFQLRREGVKASAPMFIPFLGAAVFMKELPKDAAAEARVGLAGPVLGSIGVLIPLALYFITGNELFRAIAYIGFFINLFNLLPVLPLDGGRAMAALSPGMWYVGFALLIVAAIFFFSPVMLIIALFGASETWRRWKMRKSPEARRFHTVPGRTRALIALTYVGLVVALAAGTALTFFPLSLSEV